MKYEARDDQCDIAYEHNNEPSDSIEDLPFVKLSKSRNKKAEESSEHWAPPWSLSSLLNVLNIHNLINRG